MVILVPATETTTQMVTLKMNHMCHHLGLVLLEFVWWVLAAVVVGQQEMRRLRRK
jgi:hypothetical protein